MKQGDSATSIAITLQHPEAELSYLTLSVGEQQAAKFHLSLPEARKLARTLIDYVHQAEVRRSLKRAAFKAV